MSYSRIAFTLNVKYYKGNTNSVKGLSTSELLTLYPDPFSGLLRLRDGRQVYYPSIPSGSTLSNKSLG